jgi:hypothetical protein
MLIAFTFGSLAMRIPIDWHTPNQYIFQIHKFLVFAMAPERFENLWVNCPALSDSTIVPQAKKRLPLYKQQNNRKRPKIYNNRLKEWVDTHAERFTAAAHI